jgi:hypothetical protein
MDFLGFNFLRKNSWTGSTTLWTGGVARSTALWTGGGVDERYSGALPVCGCSGSPVLAGGGREGRGRRGRAGEGLTGARVAEGRWHDGAREWRWLELGTRVEEGERELGSEGERCGVLWGWCSPFYRGWGTPGRRHL